jgi:DNA-binding beta-propeller fold protein YncE
MVFGFVINPLKIAGVTMALSILVGWSQGESHAVSPSAPAGVCSGHRIEYVRKYESTNDFISSTSVWKKLACLIFGVDRTHFLHPFTIASQDTAEVCVLDQGLGRVILIDRERDACELLDSPEYAAFPSLVGVCRGEAGEFFFTDSKLGRVFQCTSSGRRIMSLPSSVMLEQPTGIAYDAVTKTLWVVESSAHRISVIDRDGRLVSRFGRRGAGRAEFNYPTFICPHRDGSFSIVDAMNFRIQRLSRDGAFVSSFGSAGDATGYFAAIKGIATDSHDNLYVADARFHTVQIFDSTGAYLDHFGARGNGDGEFWMPVGICLDRQDRIYVADTYNRRIQQFRLIHE